MATPRRPAPRDALFALLIAGAACALVEIACRALVPASWLYAELGNPLLPKAVAFQTIDRDDHVRYLKERNALAPALHLDTGTRVADLAPSKRAAGERRWFLLGSSAARGWEVGDADRISALLEGALPGTTVVNAAILARTSEEVMRDALKVLAHHDPSGLIVYEGNNEFIGWHYPRVPRFAGLDLRPVLPLLDRSMAYKTLARLFRSARNRAILRPAEGRWYAKRALVDDGFCARFPFVPSDSFGPADWAEVRDRLVDRFAANLAVAAREANAAGVPLVLCTVPINPTLSPCYFLPQPSTLDAAKRAAMDELLRRGWGAADGGDRAGADAAFAEAVALDPSSAEAQYGLGMLRLNAGDVAGAIGPLRRARDETIGYLGSLVRINGAVRALARREGARLCDLDAAFRAASEQGGGPLRDGLFSDYCHPTAKGNRIIADALAAALRDLPAGAR